MGCSSRVVFRVRSLAILAMLCSPSIALGQQTSQSGSSFAKGKELFERQWQPKGEPDVDVIDGAQLPRLGTARTRTRTVTFFDARVRTMQLHGVVGDGLGPLHNATSCAECHSQGGASGVNHNVTLITVDPRSPALNRRREGGQDVLELFPGLLGQQGQLTFTTVVHDRSTRPGYVEIRDRIAEFVPGGIAEEWFQPQQRTSEAIAERPVIAGRNGSVDFYLSQRNSPALYGLGIIELIREERIKALAERQAEQSNGKITGRYVGKYGWKGQVMNLSTFVAQACAGELGLNQGAVSPMDGAAVGRTASARSLIDPTGRGAASGPTTTTLLTAAQAGDPADFKYVNLGVDMSPDEVAQLTSFVGSIPRPSEQPQPGDRFGDVVKGERLFGEVGCLACHVADLRPVSGIFSDLLLHDMGPRLQSPEPAPFPGLRETQVISTPNFSVQGPFVSSPQEYYGGFSSASTTAGTSPQMPKPYPMATPVEPRFPRGDVPETDAVYWDTLQREWRTPPLWGVSDTGPYLHDGRAETLEEAILWHGGEAEESRAGFEALSREDKDRVIAFLSSLRAPETVLAP